MKKRNMVQKRQSKSANVPKQQKTPVPVPVTEVVQMSTSEQQELRKRLFSSPTRPPNIEKSVVSMPRTALKSIIVEPILTESNCESRNESDQEELKGKESGNKQWETALVQSTKMAERTLQRVMRSYQKRSAMMGGANKRAISGIPYIFDTAVTRSPTAHISTTSYHVNTEQNDPPSSSQQRPPSRPTINSTKGMSPLKNRILEKSNVTTAAKVLSADKVAPISALEDDNVSEISSVQSFSALVRVDTTAIPLPVDEPKKGLPLVQPTPTEEQETVQALEQEITMDDVEGEKTADIEGKMVVQDQSISNEAVQKIPKGDGLPLPDDIEHDKTEVPIVAVELDLVKEHEEIIPIPAAALENPASHSSSSSSSSSKSSKSSNSDEKKILVQEDSSEPLPSTERAIIAEDADADEEDDIAIDNRFLNKLNNKYEEFRSFRDD